MRLLYCIVVVVVVAAAVAAVVVVVVVAAAAAVTVVVAAAIVVEVVVVVVTKSKIRMTTALKGSVRDFWQCSHCDTNCLQHVRPCGQGTIVCKSRAAHRALNMCNMSSATWYAGTAHQFIFDRVELVFISASFHWLKP